jgi:hemerythrin superfamily protein
MPAPASSHVTSSHVSHATGIHAVQCPASTTLRPLAGVFETLAEQHRQVLDLLRRAASTRGRVKRRELWTRARRQLLSHERAEEQAVYAALEGYDAAQPLLGQHGDQAVELELAIADLDAIDCASKEWIEVLRQVTARVEEHIHDEESDFFPRAQELLGENTARDLDDSFSKAQREVRMALA